MTDRPAPPRAVRDEAFDRTAEVPAADEDAYGQGVYRRRIRLVNLGPGHTAGELEDDFHHFRIDLRHDGHTILAADGTAVRGPWSTCFDADVPLRAIEGRPLAASSSAIGSYTSARSNCTHLFDLTGLAMAHGARGTPERLYDFEATDADAEGTQRVRCWRDGEALLDWTVRDRQVLDPPSWSEVPLFVKFIPWAEEHLDPDTAEAAVALRRVITISNGRAMDLDRFDRASDLYEHQGNTCHSFSPAQAPVALRRRGSMRDFQDHPEVLLADMGVRDAAAREAAGR